MDVSVVKIENGKYFNQLGEQVIKCELCFSNNTTSLGTKRCDRCWELETRIHTDLCLAKKIIAKLEDRNL